YLESAIKLTHVMLKLLEQYSQKNQVMFVRKKKKTKKTKSNTTTRNESGSGDEHTMDIISEEEISNKAVNESDHDNSDDDDEEDDDDERERELAYREHIFTFQSFEKKYLTVNIVQVYCILLEQFETLSPETLYCITSLFHRIMVKRKVEDVFFKINVLELFNRIIYTYPSLPKSGAMSELVQFIRYCTRQFFKKANEYPLLYVEVLFKNPKGKTSSRIQ
ncbi:hypothetical protein INT45_008102, partial [Circinella minor]